MNFPDKRKTWLLAALFVLINGIVFYNALFHNPRTGYDADAHIMYMGTLSGGQLPSREQTYEYFSPPLPYIIPALSFRHFSRYPVLRTEAELSVKFAQLSQWLLSIGVTLLLLRFCERLRPKNVNFKLAALAFLGVLPVYYKTFAFMRGEPWVLFFGLLAAYEFLAFLQEYRQQPRLYGRALRIGLWLGLAIMSRQWAIFLVTAVAVVILREIWVYARAKAEQGNAPSLLERVHLPFWGAVALMALVTMLVGGWFFVHLYLTTGRFTAFNETAQAQFSLANQPASFYTDLALDKLFSDPVRPALPNKFWPQFYAEMWGDYFAYFLVSGWDSHAEEYVFDG
ncbi:MAG: hypothetical protein KC443_26135, partial [Anaerolineales bacterium]|nr:hypothetical protein [Anaerolineales bacterium]